jgi:lipopolysaccharide transport system ATP-binding protein
MSTTVISVENLSKSYQLGVINTGTFYGDIKRWWAKQRGKPDPYLKIGETDHGNRKRETIWALKDVNFETKQGEALGIIGRNGAGKSTLLKIMSQVTAPTSGVVRIKGRIASLLEVGTGFHPELTGRENIYLNGAIMGMNRDEVRRKFDEIVDFSGVEQFIDTPVKRYSSGMYVRLAFAVAAHLEPEILVIDEVLAVGDAEFQKKCLGKMGDVAKEGRTVLFVSHNMAAINRLCSRAILLNAGKAVEDGSALDVTSRYLSNAEEESGARVWNMDQAPGTDDLRLVSIKLIGKDNKKASVVEVHDKITIRIEYRVNKGGLRFRCALLFFTQGVLAFGSLEPREEVRPSVGNYYSLVTIPPHLLTEGEYLVGVSIFTSSGAKLRYVTLKDAIAFQVYDSMIGPSARGDYVQNLGGVIRPLLEWKTDSVSTISP